MTPDVSCSTARVPRRRVLHGLGVSLCLPWLESLPVAAAGDKGSSAASGPPQRVAFFYIANGVRGWDKTRQAADGGIDFDFGLAPLAGLAKDVNVAHGLYHPGGAQNGTHGAKAASMLSGAKANHSTTEVRIAESFDQLLARTWGGGTHLPSLDLSCEPPCPGNDVGYASVYLNNISWKTATVPVPREFNPALAFDSVTGRGGRGASTKKILDLVLGDARDLRRRVSTADQRRLDDYLESVGDLERRIDRSFATAADAAWHPAISDPDMDRPADRPYPDIAERTQLMVDVLALAFRMDRTRIGTVMLNNERSDASYRKVVAKATAAYHDISHGGEHPHADIVAYIATVFAGFLQKLKDTREGETSILDNSQILLAGSMLYGPSHDSKRLPVLMAGRAGGRMKTGQVLDFATAGDEKRRLNRLFLSMARNIGLELPRFGDADSPLEEFCS
jgi:hypothetical protein